MKQRCYNPRATGHEEYAARGTTVCDRWRHDFAVFLSDMGPKPSPDHSIDRIACDVPFPGPVSDFVDDFDNHRKVEPSLSTWSYPTARHARKEERADE